MRIDMHAHYVPPKALEQLKGSSPFGAHLEEAAAGGPSGQCLCFDYGLRIRPFFPRLLDLDDRWVQMESQGVDHQILTVWADTFGYGVPAAESSRWHRLLNEHLSETARAHPDKLSMMASVPLQDADRAATELEYGIKQCGAVGGVIGASVDGVNLGDADLDNFWAAACELNVPLFIHPTAPTPSPRTTKYDLNVSVQYTYDTTVSVGSLVLSGVMDRFPNLRLLLSHGGGYFPYQISRFDRLYRNHLDEVPLIPAQTPSAYLRRFWYDTILHGGPALRYLCDLVGTDRVLLGTDYPFTVYDPIPLEIIEAAGCSGDDFARITEGNSKELFGL